MTIRLTARVILAATAILLFLPGSALAQIYLCTASSPTGTMDIPGGVTAEGYVGCIDLTSASLSVSRSVDLSTQGATLGNPSFSEVTVTKSFDVATVKLHQNMLTGVTHADWGIHYTSTCMESAVDFFTVRLKDVVISTVSSNGDPSQPPAETVSLAFGEIEYKSNTADMAGDCSGNEMNFAWDVINNRPR